jgi:hypothetical protein
MLYRMSLPPMAIQPAAPTTLPSRLVIMRSAAFIAIAIGIWITEIAFFFLVAFVLRKLDVESPGGFWVMAIALIAFAFPAFYWLCRRNIAVNTATCASISIVLSVFSYFIVINTAFAISAILFGM